jgi:hypothetical protein
VAGHGGDAALLRAGHEVVDEDAQPASRTRAELGDGVDEVVDAGLGLDDHPFRAQVVAPDPFDELGVVDAFHPDPRLPSDQRTVCTDRERTAGGPAGPAGRGGGRAAQGDDHAVEEEGAGCEREQPPSTMTILQHHRTGLEPDDRAAEAGAHVLDHQLRVRLHDRNRGPGQPGREHVEFVSPHETRP